MMTKKKNYDLRKRKKKSIVQRREMKMETFYHENYAFHLNWVQWWWQWAYIFCTVMQKINKHNTKANDTLQICVRSLTVRNSYRALASIHSTDSSTMRLCVTSIHSLHCSIVWVWFAITGSTRKENVILNSVAMIWISRRMKEFTAMAVKMKKIHSDVRHFLFQQISWQKFMFHSVNR